MRDVDLAFWRQAFEAENYICEDELLITVSLALKLGRPLLIEGAPGVGKTEIAKVLARVLETELIRLQCYEGLDESKALYEWNYQGQLLKIQLMREANGNPMREEEIFSAKYLLERPLLKAIRSDRQVVLLIDEIDKTDQEFEAFLFEVLSDFQVSIPELGTVKARHLPVVVLTSNQERELSDGLRRRCVYLYIDYPSPEKEQEILRCKIPAAGYRLIWEIATTVHYLRYELDLEKPPSTSETLDWGKVLAEWKIEKMDPQTVRQTLGILLKNHQDMMTFQHKIGFEGLCTMLRSAWDGADLAAKGDSLLARAIKKKEPSAVTAFLRIPWQFLKRVAVAKPNHKAIFGTACRDFALQLKQGAPQSGGEGTHEERTRRHMKPAELERINPADLPGIIRRLRRVFRNLRVVPSRRSKMDPTARMLDVRKSILRSLRYGGDWIPFAFRRRKLRQPNLVVLCDVSASMIQHVGFTVPLLFALSHSTAKVNAFVCAGDLEPVTGYFKQTSDFASAVDRLLQETTQVGRGTQLARSFQQLLQQPDIRLASSTCLIVVSDAETIEPDECVRMLKRLAGRVRKVLWLNTQSRDLWNRAVVGELRRHCGMEICTSLNQTIRCLNRL